MHRSALLALLLAAASLAQDSDPTVRSLPDKGVTFKLPAGWSWATDANVIRIKQTVTVKEVEHEMTGELVYETDKFADEQVKDIRKKVDESQGSLKDLKIEKKKPIGSGKPLKATACSFVRVRGEGQDATLFEERVFVFRRGDGCFTWTEQNPKAISGQASGAFDAARKAFKFSETTETSVPDVREFKGIKGQYKLPEEFEWLDRAEAKRGELKEEGTVARFYTDVDVKGDTQKCQFLLNLQKIKEGYKADQSTIWDQWKKDQDSVTKVFVEDLHDIENYSIEKKGDLNGERCVTASWVASFEKNGRKHVFTRMAFAKRGHIISWIEVVPWSKTRAKEVEEATKLARSGFTM
ncbi:MAG TPA: hypothetical protein VEI02_08970 [Planctomycetota bacterium]|nr:hypothetical protein [Planctomycetota bacterium]